MPLEAMPLAAGYLKATALADPVIREAAEIDISNFRGGTSWLRMASDLFGEQVAAMFACSVCGWTLPPFRGLAATCTPLNPGGLVVFAGTHVRIQADRTFRLSPEVEVVVNGEGERTFRELLHAWLADTS